MSFWVRAEMTFHVHKLKRGWCVRRGGSSRALSIHDQKADAVAEGRGVARRARGSLIIHNKAGLVTARHSYE